jgi:hypothetical protein
MKDLASFDNLINRTVNGNLRNNYLQTALLSGGRLSRAEANEILSGLGYIATDSNGKAVVNLTDEIILLN